MNDADGIIEGGRGVAVDVDGEEEEEDGLSQPLVTSSEEMRSSMTPSGTRFPAWMSASA